MSSPRPNTLSSHDLHRIAALANVDPRTVKAYLTDTRKRKLPLLESAIEAARKSLNISVGE
jgi:hypothetical protein